MNWNRVWKFTAIPKRRGFAGIFALGFIATGLTIGAALDDSLTTSLSDRQQVVATSTGDQEVGVDNMPTSEASNLELPGTPPNPLKACCTYADGSIVGVCAYRVDPEECRANGGVAVPSCFTRCPSRRPLD